MNVLNISSFVLITLLLISHLTEGKPKGRNEESYVPEDIEEGFSIDEEEETPSDSNPQKERPKWSESTIDEYMKEHPEVKQMPTTDEKHVNMKRIYNQYGNVVSIPITTTPKVLFPDFQQLSSFPYPYPYYPFMINPYLNSRQVMPNIPMVPRPPVLPGTPVTPEEAAKYQMPADREEKDLKTKSDLELNEKIYNLMGSYPKFPFNQNYTNGMNGTSVLPMPFPLQTPFQPSRHNQLPRQFQKQHLPGQLPMNAMVGPYPHFPPYPPFPFYVDPRQLKVDGKNIKVNRMPFPNDIVIDTDLFKKIQSGAVKLDMINAKIIPITEEPTTEPTMGTESESLDNRPELPEVVFPKTTVEPTTARPTTPNRKSKYKRFNTKRRHPYHRRAKLHPNEAPKPHFIMKATLKHLPKKGEKGKDKWWNQPIPEYCFEPIYEFTLCKDKHLEKRWSFNKKDGKCYLYEDECHSVKKNTFKTIKECMYTCWRPK